jgi:anti-sigma regulatory factor (Ser/Thr protein kinase)
MSEKTLRYAVGSTWYGMGTQGRMQAHTEDSPRFMATLPSAVSAIPSTLEAVGCFARGCGSTDCYGLLIVARELLMNAIVHGNRCDPAKEARLVILSMGPDLFDIVVKDEGAGFDYSALLPDVLASAGKARRFGYLLIEELADELEFARSGCSIRARVRGDANRIVDVESTIRKGIGMEGQP